MNGTANTWTYNLAAGTLGGTAIVTDFNATGGSMQSSAEVDFIHTVMISGGMFDSGSKIATVPWGEDNGHIVQTGGAMNGGVVAVTYDMTGGTMGGTAVIDVSDHFTLAGDATITSGATINKGDSRLDLGQTSYDDNGSPYYLDDGSVPSPIDTFAQSGGTMNGKVTTDLYTQSGGALGGTVATGTYDLTNASATSTGATIAASTAFTLEPTTGTATVAAKLTGTGKLTKSGAGIVVLTNSANDFTGGIAIDGGTLESINDALPDGAAITVATNATLAMSIDNGVTTTFGGTITGAAGTLLKAGAGTLNLTGALVIGTLGVDGGTLHVTNGALGNTGAITVAEGATLQVTVDNGKSVSFDHSMSGATGELIKDGAGTLTLGGTVYLGALDVDAGRLEIGTGAEDTADSASFDSAVIKSGATLYVAKGATLTIRVPNNIINDGFLINDGTVNDDLDNNATFNNNSAYNANVASNTGTINNNTPGVWTGNILTNAGTITNNGGAKWDGAIQNNSGQIVNMVGGTWTHGAVDANTGMVTNRGTWTGDIDGNGTPGYWPGWTYGLVYNDKNAIWTGNVVDNNGSVRNVAGTWNGDVVDNHNDLMNDNSSDELDLGHWNGNVVANHGLVFNAGGGIWTGDVLSNDGRILSDRAAHHTVATDNSEWHGNVLGNAGMIESRAFWYGNLQGNAGIVVNNGWWNGTIGAGNTGTVYNAEDDYGVPVYDKIRPTWTGAVNGNAGTILNIGADWIGNVGANTGNISNSRGSFNGFQLGDSTWSGNIVTNAGSITNAAGSSWTGDVESNAGTITTAGVWTGAFNNAGTVNAQNQIIGAFANAGTMHVTGALSGITTFTNTGTLDMHGNGATQTMGVATASFGSGSFLNLDIDPAAASDRLAVTGLAALDGTVRVTAASTGNAYGVMTPYTILTAGTIDGSFAGVTTDLAFLAPRLSYDAHDVYLTVMRNDVGFADVGVTSNQRATGAAVESLGAGNSLYDAVLWLNRGQAEQAFDGLSGEMYGSLQTAQLQDAGLVADAATGRLDQAFDALGDGGVAVSNYAAGAAPAAPIHSSGVWGQIYGARGTIAGNGNSAATTASTGGYVGGFDGELDDWRLGLLLQAGASSGAVSDRNSSSTSTEYGLGVYGGRQWGGTRLSLGASYTHHDVQSSRDVAFPAFTDHLSASYGAGTSQAFGKLSQRFDLGAVSLIPFASLAYVAEGTDGFVESGGAAALTVSADLVTATFATLGVGIDHKFVVGDGMLLTATGSLGWRRAFADAPRLSAAFAGGTGFTVVGAPLDGDTLVLSAGLNLDVSPDATLNLSYDGQIGTTTQTHALKGTWNTRF